MVLFLFVIMMLDVRLDSLRAGFWKHFPLAALVGVFIALEMAAVLLGGFRGTEAPHTVAALGQAPAELSNTRELGKVLYTQYLYPLQIAAAILLVAMIAAIALTLRRRKDNKAINAADQVRVKAKDRLTVIKMDSSPMAAADPVPAAAAGENK